MLRSPRVMAVVQKQQQQREQQLAAGVTPQELNTFYDSAISYYSTAVAMYVWVRKNHTNPAANDKQKILHTAAVQQ